MRGAVKFFDDVKGFGFIVPAGGGADLFVHYTAIEGTGHRSLAVGEVVEFTVEWTDRRQAGHVRRVVPADVPRVVRWEVDGQPQAVHADQGMVKNKILQTMDSLLRSRTAGTYTVRFELAYDTQENDPVYHVTKETTENAAERHVIEDRYFDQPIGQECNRTIEMRAATAAGNNSHNPGF